jgi:hypothetical protein
MVSPFLFAKQQKRKPIFSIIAFHKIPPIKSLLGFSAIIPGRKLAVHWYLSGVDNLLKKYYQALNCLY